MQLGGKLFTQQRPGMENLLTLPLNQCADGNQENWAWNSSLRFILYALFLDPLLVLIEYIPYGDLLGYLRKSRRLNDNLLRRPGYQAQNQSDVTTASEICLANRWRNELLIFEKGKYNRWNKKNRVQKISSAFLMAFNSLLNLKKREK